MSSIPIKESIQTCILSTRWKDVFTSISDIDLDGRLENKALRNMFMNFVDRFLLSRKDISVNRFHLNCGDGMDLCRIIGWIQYALRHNVRELNLSIETRPFTELEFGSFTCERLESLRLCLSPNFILRVPTNCRLPNLRVIRLQHLKIPDNESIPRLISSCNSLEELFILSCAWFNVNNKLSVCNPKLKRLTISTWRQVVYEVEINTPNLVFFEYHFLCCAGTKHSFINLNSLSEAHIWIAINSYYTDAAHASDLISGISHARSLQLITRCNLEPFSPQPIMVQTLGAVPWFPNLTYLSTDGCCVGLGILLPRCPYLETLGFEVGDMGEIERHTRKEVPSCLVHRIKRINIYEFEGTQVEFKLLEYLLEKAGVLECLTVEMSVQERERTMTGNKIIALPKASNKCMIKILWED